MAPSSSSSSSSSSIPSISPPPLHPPPFTPIMECEREGNEDRESQERNSFRSTPNDRMDQQTPLHLSFENRGKPSNRKSSGTDRHDNAAAGYDDDRGISCNKCRPNSREKISVVPLDNNGINRQSMASPNGLFKSIFSSLVKKSPRLSDVSSTATSREEQWKIVAAELSHKLLQASRKRDEAVQEASKLKYSMAEIEKKLNKLEIYCHQLKSGLDECSNNSPHQNGQIDKIHALKHERIGISVGNQNNKVVEHFLVTVSEARSTVRFLGRSLALQLRRMGSKVYDRISLLLQPYDIKISLSRNPRGLMVYLESLLNMAFFEDFETTGFQKSSSNQILNPIDRCEANFASFGRLQGLTWEDVLNKGTKHFNEEFSKFCDRKMSEIVAMLGWNRAWPEPLLQAFFGASKSVWLVHLLANSVYPGLPIFRVNKGARFDSIYMEDMGGEKARNLVPAMVRIMVVPGFYVYGNVVKCKVLCRYHNNVNGSSDIVEEEEKGLTPSPI